LKKVRVIQYGIGAIGKSMAKLVLKRDDLKLVAAVSRSQAGKDLGEVFGGKKLGIPVYAPNEIFNKVKADIMLHAAVSYVKDAWPQIEPALRNGINVITIAEEMGYPRTRFPRLSKKIDTLAKRCGVTVLGTGINPGFMMDALPLMITGITRKVEKIKVTRYLDFSGLGPQAQKLKGTGLSASEFRSKVKKGELPLHVGLLESLYMVAEGLGFEVKKTVETRSPYLAERNLNIKGFTKIPKGRVAGYNHNGHAYCEKSEVIHLEERGRVDPKIDYKLTIDVKGVPDLHLEMNVPPSQFTTSSHAVNLIKVVCDFKNGLVTMKDLPIAIGHY
jgi:2,4-diaminopentanoate dehydrogenase